MNVGFIIVLFNTSKEEQDRLKKEIDALQLPKYHIYFIDNTNTGKGFAYGVNQGILQAQKDKTDVFVVANPDISLKTMTGKELLRGGDHFDIWGYSMVQGNTHYYLGMVDKWRLSSVLTTEKPESAFAPCQYVTGSLMCIKKSVVGKIGAWDESYFMYYEDVDYCTRARRAGFTVGVDVNAAYTHFEVSQFNALKRKQIAASRHKYFMKYANLFQMIREFIRLPKTLYEAY